MKGLVLYKIGNFTEANKIYDTVISNDIAVNEKQVSILYYSKGRILYQLGDYEKAIPIFNKAIKSDSTNGEFYFYKGESYFKLGKYGDALESYEKAIQLNPGDNRSLIKKELIINSGGLIESFN